MKSSVAGSVEVVWSETLLSDLGFVVEVCGSSEEGHDWGEEKEDPLK